MTMEQVQEHQDRINSGEQAKNFLASREWLELVKPIIDSMVRGVTDVRGKKSVEEAVICKVNDKWQPIEGTEKIYKS